MMYRYKELSIISENLGSLYEDGLEIDMSFSLLQEIPLSSKYRDSLKYIRKSILKGESLADSFEKYNDLYPEFFVGLIRVGENSGNLGEVLISISKFYSKQEKIKSEIIGALIYPVFLIGALFLLSVFLVFFIVPNFYNIFSNNIEEIPDAIQFINSIRISFMDNPISMILFIICWGIIIPIILIKSINSKEFIDCISLKFKIIRDVYEYVLILILSIIFKSSIPINLGIELAISSVGIVAFKKELKRVNERILKGEELSIALSEILFVSKYTLSVITVAEKSGSLEESLNKLEKKLEYNIKKSFDRNVKLVQPTITIGMAIGVSLFIIIFILPMFDMIYSGVK